MSDVRFLEIEPTTRCNFTCGFCLGRHLEQRDAELATFQAALESFPATTHLELQGEGEPLLQARFFEMVALARARGIGVSCITNGSLLSEENVGRILDADLDKVLVSFESLDPVTFRRLRGGLLEKVVDGLTRLVRARDARRLRRPAIGLALTVLRDTRGELPAFVALYRRLGLDGGINLQPLNPMPAYRRHYDGFLDGQLMSDAELREQLGSLRAEPVHGIVLDGTSRTRGFFDELFADFQPSRRRCPWLERGAFVTADGWVTPCCTIKDGERAGFGRVGPADAQKREAARAAMVAELSAGRTPEACRGCAVAAVALGASVDGQDPVAASVGLELEFSWVHASWLALQRDLAVRLLPAITNAVVRLEELQRQAAPAPALAAGVQRLAADEPAVDDHGGVAALKDRVEGLEREQASLAAGLAASQARVNALVDSWSWRLAAPLRAVHGLFARLRR